MLQDPKLNQAEEASITVKILSDEKARVSVKTRDNCFYPSSTDDNSEGTWYGGMYEPGPDTVSHDPSKRVRRQKTLISSRKTIFTSTLKRIEWRER